MRLNEPSKTISAGFFWIRIWTSQLANSYSLWLTDLSTDIGAGTLIAVTKTGVFRLHLKISKATPSSLKLLCNGVQSTHQDPNPSDCAGFLTMNTDQPAFLLEEAPNSNNGTVLCVREEHQFPLVFLPFSFPFLSLKPPSKQQVWWTLCIFLLSLSLVLWILWPISLCIPAVSFIRITSPSNL